MKIIHIPRRFVKEEWGGTETAVLEISKNMLEMNHEVKLFTSNALADKNKEFIEKVPIERFNYFYPVLGLSKLDKAQLDKKGGNLFSFTLLKALKRENIDIIHIHTMKRLGGIARYVAKKKKIPYVVTIHGGLFHVPASEKENIVSPLKNTFEWGKLLGFWVGSHKVLNDSSAIICVDKNEAKTIQEKYPNKKVLFMPNGVDFNHFSRCNNKNFRNKFNIPQNSFLILVVGRIDPQKNQIFLVKAFNKMLELVNNLHILIVGPVTSQNYYNEILETIEKNDIKKYFTIIKGLPYEGDLVNAYHSADLFILPSVHEPFGMVILEAWASGLPVIASKVGGIVNFVEHNENGLLFNPKSEENFIENFKIYVQNKDLSNKHSFAGKNLAKENYSWNNISKNLIKLYSELI